MKKILYLLIPCLILVNCSIDPCTGEKKISNTAKGAIIGTAGGAVAGSLSNGKNGALKGALIGGVAGTATGGYMDIQAKALREELQGTGVQVSFNDNRINLIMPGNITFKTGNADVKSSFYPVLNSISKILIKYKKTTIQIIGYTDNTGSVEINKKLSLERAQSVADYLKNHSISSNRIITKGLGSQNPIASNSTVEGREQNRRVEINLIQKNN